jgi:hypothetical protein
MQGPGVGQTIDSAWFRWFFICPAGEKVPVAGKKRA